MLFEYLAACGLGLIAGICIGVLSHPEEKFWTPTRLVQFMLFVGAFVLMLKNPDYRNQAAIAFFFLFSLMAVALVESRRLLRERKGLGPVTSSMDEPIPKSEPDDGMRSNFAILLGMSERQTLAWCGQRDRQIAH